ncbi:CLIP-associating protein-like isoform X4 [Photinus pyralis]|nr:CLIP-associating protein-like isoform X4 [Photinus pyralis]
MAYVCPKDLDGFMPHLPKADTKFRQQLGIDLLAYLDEPSNSIICQDIGQLIDGLIPWMQSSNYKVSSNGIEVMTSLIDRLGHDFRPYLQTVLPAVIDRLGDSKDTVREKAQLLILKLLERNVLTPQTLLEKLTPGFTHKNAKIREEVLRCLVNTLNEHGAQSVTLSKFISYIVKLLSDPTATVRDTAFSTLVDLYKHVGEKLKVDLQRRNLVPSTRLPALLLRFDEVKSAGELLPTACCALDLGMDEIDRISMPKPAVPVKKVGLLTSASKRTVSAPSKMAAGASAPNLATVSRTGSMRKATSASGAVDEKTFTSSFEEVPNTQIFSARELGEQMKAVQEIIADPNKEWYKRVDALKKVRALVIAGATNYEEFYINLRNLEIPLQGTLKDLRSQVVREACITIAYLSQVIGNKFDHCSECLLNGLINLIQNSAKVVATAGNITVRFILQYTQHHRLIPIITTNLGGSKSKEIRRSCCEFLELILTQWATHPLEKHINVLQEALRKGIADADPEARVCSRRAFRGFKDHFPDQAESLLQSLEPSYRRALQGELCLSSSSSSNSLAPTPGVRTPRQYRVPTTPQSATGSTENLYSGGLQRVPSLPRSYRQRSSIPVLSRDNSKKGFRSNSAIDLQAAQRAKARAQYSAMTRQKVAFGTASLQGEVAQQARPKRTELAAMQSPERLGRTRSRNAQVSHSQPTSRSGSPSSRLPYLYSRTDHDSPRPRRLSSGIPRSTTGSRDTSRETSPTRGSSLSRLRGANDRPPLSPASRPVMAQKILQQSREAESAFADAFFTQTDSSEYHRLQSPRKGMRSLENHSDDSETSSLCSEKSFDSYRRPSDDINEIIQMCTSTVWQERKDGLVSLRHYLNSGSNLTSAELKHITEIFTRMFMDSHTKGLCVFLDTVNELIKRHKNELHDWLYVLLQRIFHKLGTDLLSSTHAKLLNTLDIIKKNFPVQLQLACVYRFLVDATQTPNSKVKVAVLTFLTSLCHMSEPNQFVSKPPAIQALQKIIGYAQDFKSVEIRQAAKNAFVALWNCNTQQVILMLSELPKEQQEVASTIAHNHLRKSSTGSEPGSPLVASSPKALSPTTLPGRVDDFNREEIFKSLQKTTAEIQNYSYETLGSKLDKDRDTTSQDSGISQMSLGNDIKSDVITLEERMEELTIRPNYVSQTGCRSLPYSLNGIETNLNGYSGTLDEADNEELIKKILQVCLVDNPASVTDKQKLLSQLVLLIKKGQVDAIIPQFKKLLRVLIDNLDVPDCNTQVIVLEVFAEIFKNDNMRQCWSNFVELLTLRVLNAHCSDKREVVKAAELTAAAMSVFPFNAIISVLSPLIHTSACPTIQGAIKMLTKLIEVHPLEVTDDHLGSVMPGLIKANDHEESAVRKSAVFCMVALHKAVGEERLAPYITSLTGSKLKLLRLYIERAHSIQSSPKNSANSHNSLS